MPEGVQGFQKGRPKTGGRTKGVSNKKATKFIEQMKMAGFDYVKELSWALKELKGNLDDSGRSLNLKVYYGELKNLLPYMAPKLREKEVVTAEQPETPALDDSNISTDDLVNALNGQKEDKPRASSKHPVETRGSKLPVPASTEENLPDVGSEQKED